MHERRRAAVAVSASQSPVHLLSTFFPCLIVDVPVFRAFSSPERVSYSIIRQLFLDAALWLRIYWSYPTFLPALLGMLSIVVDPRETILPRHLPSVACQSCLLRFPLYSGERSAGYTFGAVA